nr:MAG TPA: hypothetical protein [Inoviridae sp.]
MIKFSAYQRNDKTERKACGAANFKFILRGVEF